MVWWHPVTSYFSFLALWIEMYESIQLKPQNPKGFNLCSAEQNYFSWPKISTWSSYIHECHMGSPQSRKVAHEHMKLFFFGYWNILLSNSWIISIFPPSCSCLKWTILTAIQIYDNQRGNQNTVAPLNLPYQALYTKIYLYWVKQIHVPWNG